MKHFRSSRLTLPLPLPKLAVYVPVVAQGTNGATSMSDKRKQSLYFPEAMLQEIQTEANRQDRSLSWIVQQAWRVARGEIKKFPSVNDVMGELEADSAQG